MVSYRGANGEQSYHETDELNEAIAYVEHLRNNEAVDHAQIFKLDEVSFEFRPYFRVEIAGAAPAPETTADSTPWLASAQAEDAADDADRDPLVSAWVASERPEDRDESVPAGMGRRGLFGR
jgi:hypothetical protein